MRAIVHHTIVEEQSMRLILRSRTISTRLAGLALISGIVFIPRQSFAQG